MKFYTQPHDFYCGIDLHARSMYLCVLDRDGKIVLHHNMASAPEPFLEAISPYRGNLVVGVECIFCWYWLADLCAAEKIPSHSDEDRRVARFPPDHRQSFAMSARG